MQQLHLRLTSSFEWCATGEFQWRRQCWGHFQLHVPCRRGNSSAQVEVQVGENYTIEQQSSSSRCDPSRCSVRKRSALQLYPQNRRAVQPQMPREPVWMVHTIDISEQHQRQQKMRI